MNEGDRATAGIVWLATGGTIAGAALGDARGYRAGAFSGAELMQRLVPDVPALAAAAVELHDVAQIDSKDMTPAVWLALIQAARHHLARDDVRGLVITHGTDTLEETAYCLQRVLAPRKPVVVTGAMRPATAVDADGPRNLADALVLASHAQAQGVLVSFNGKAWSAGEARKVHSRSVDAFAAGDGRPVASIDAGSVQVLREWPDGTPLPHIEPDPARWPVVEIVHSHAGARAATVDALRAAGAQGLVVACTGNGTVHADLLPALDRARAAGVAVLRASRCAAGGIDDAAAGAGGLPHAGELTPAQARVELQLRLMNPG